MQRIDRQSILFKVLVPMLLVTIIQVAVFYCWIVMSGTIAHLDQNSTTLLESKDTEQAKYIQNEMITRWGNMDAFMSSFHAALEEYLSKNTTSVEGINLNEASQKEILEKMAPEMIQMLRHNGINGVFLILNGNTGIHEPTQGATLVKQGLCIRDFDQESGYLNDNDLYIERAPASILDTLDLNLNSTWHSVYQFTYGDDFDYYFKPLKAAAENPTADWKDLGYWSKAHQFNDDGISVFSYSVPLMGSNGEILGVAGIEILESYLQKYMPSADLNHKNKGQFLLCITENQGQSYSVISQTGYPYHVKTKQENYLEFAQGNETCLKLSNMKTNEEQVYGCIYPLKLYSNNSPFEDEEWVLAALLNKEELFAFSMNVEFAMIAATMMSLFVAICGVYTLSRRFAKPIERLSNMINNNTDGREQLQLEKIKIREIDQLVEKIAGLQKKDKENNQTLSTIIQLAGLPISTFEIDKVRKQIFFTEGFFHVIDSKQLYEAYKAGKGYEFFMQFFKENSMAMVTSEAVGDKWEATYHFFNDRQEERWVNIHAIKTEEKTLGVIMDITKDFSEKIKLQHERDHDLLTGLFNRRAFHSKVTELFCEPERIGIGAMVMIDLDNLKFVNDTYGHDYGDEYIKGAAEALEESLNNHMFVGRMSGDEFNVFLYDYKSKEDVEKQLEIIQQRIRNKEIALPGGGRLAVRMSGGIAWYPEDSTDLDELIHYADFAMYQVKKATKGEYHSFNKASYIRDAYLLKNRGELNHIIEERLIKYHFQPIVSARTGEIYAYEALMRPQGDVIKSADEMLTLAKTQGRLYHIEKLTWMMALESFHQLQDRLAPNAKIFVNSVSNQVLSHQDIQTFSETFKDYLGRIVLELTEEERANIEYTSIKQDYINQWNAQTALDDFGAGYNGENLLLELNPDYVKVDMNIIRGIDKDENRQAVFNNLIQYTRSRNIMVIAEGVETEGELRYVCNGGVDYVQGYLLARPEEVPQGISKEAKKIFSSFQQG